MKYRASSRFEKLGYEEEFLNKIRRLDDEVKRKIEKNERRLAVTQPIPNRTFFFEFFIKFFTAISLSNRLNFTRVKYVC